MKTYWLLIKARADVKPRDQKKQANSKGTLLMSPGTSEYRVRLAIKLLILKFFFNIGGFTQPLVERNLFPSIHLSEDLPWVPFIDVSLKE